MERWMLTDWLVNSLKFDKQKFFAYFGIEHNLLSAAAVWEYFATFLCCTVLRHSTAPCVALHRQDRHTIRQMRHDAVLLRVRRRSRTAPSGVAADEHCSQSFVSIFW
ncbi:hypothetical protein Y032_0091g2502 [Ancylostoma ceylanicum]|nr:hypothetical protein Y032_0091g2502 [Ancylostoma ceylanicum]